MEQSEVDSIIGGQSGTPSFLEEDTQQQTADIRADTSKPYVCDMCHKSFSTQLALIGHKRSHGISKKEKTDSIFSQNKPESLTFPPDYQILLDALKRWSIPKAEAIAQSMTLTHLDDYTKLRELLVSFSVVANLREGFMAYWQGVRNAINQKPIETSKTNNDFASIDEDLAFEQKVYRMQIYKEARGGSNSNKSNPELESMRMQVQQILEQNRQLQNQLAENQRKAEMEKLSEQNRFLAEEIKKTKENSEAAAGSLSSGMKDFSQSLVNLIEKRDMEDKHRWEMFSKEKDFKEHLDALKEELRSTGANLTGADKMINVMDKTVTNAGAAFAGLARENISNERALLLSNLISQGVPYAQAMQVITGRAVPNAEQEYRNLQRVTQDMEAEKAAKEAAKPEPEIQIAEPEPTVKFNTGD